MLHKNGIVIGGVLLLVGLVAVPAHAWERLEQLPVPTPRELKKDEKTLFNQSVKSMVMGDNESAVRTLKPMAETGVVDAQMALGNILTHAEGDTPRKEGYRFMYMAANGGNWNAQVVISKAFRDGIYTAVNFDKARHWLKRAAVAGDASVVSNEFDQLDQTVMLEAVSAMEQAQYDAAEKLLAGLAEENVVEAQEKLAGIYQNGFLGEDKKDLANRWWHEAAQLGSQEAQYRLAMNYLSNPELKQEQRKAAIEMLERAAQPGKADAQYQLGIIYLTGKGADKNPDKGIFYYRMAAEQGHMDAQYSLGVRYVLGEGVGKNDYEAHRWFKAAADQGMPKAMHNLALTYLHGMGTEKNQNDAEHWFRSAARDGVEKSTVFLNPSQLDGDVAPVFVSAAEPAKASFSKGKIERAPAKRKPVEIKAKRQYETVYGADWFLNLPQKGFTIQVLTAAKSNSVDAFFKQNRLKKKGYLHYIDRTHKRPYHVIQYGYYRSRGEAEQAARKLAKGKKDFKPWIRDVKTIRSKIVSL